jgi:putative ABC transport system permease protein
MANQESTQTMTQNFNSTITAMEEQINKTSTLIECSIAGSNQFQGNRSGFPFGGPPGSFQSQEQGHINDTVVSEIRSFSGVANVVGFLQASSNETTSETINAPGGRIFTISRPLYTISGVCLNSSVVNEYSVLPTNVTAGRSLQQGDTGVVLMSLNLSEYFGATVGDKVDVNGETFTIVGIYEQTGQRQIQSRTVYMNITDAQIITNNVGNVSTLDAYANSTDYVDTIAEAIQLTYSDLQVTTYKDRLSQLQSYQTQYSERLTEAQSTLSQTQTIATQEIIIAVVASSLIVLFVMLYTVRERTREIGTLKAIGFSNWSVMGQFVLEGTLLGVAAGVVGVVLGTLLAPVLSSLLLPHLNLFGGQSIGFGPSSGLSNLGLQTGSAAVAVSPQLILFAFGAAVILGALGSLYPAWRAARTRPAEAMRYE